jgi:hypothetical protein
MKAILAAFFLLVMTAAAYATGVFGTVVGAKPASGTAIGAGVSFSTANTALFAPQSASLNLSGSFSITFVINTTIPLSDAIVRVLVGNTSPILAGPSGFDIRNGPNSLYAGLVALVRPGAGNCGATKTSIGKTVCARWSYVNDGFDHLIQFTWDGTCESIYTDGQLRDQQCYSLTYTPNTNFWQVGDTDPSAMTIKDLRVYSRVLTGEEMRAQYYLLLNGLVPNSGSLQTDSLVAYWSFASPCPCTDSINSNVLQVDAPAPVVTITGPSGTVSGSQTITATCTDTVNCVSVTFTVDGVVQGTDTTSPYTQTWNTANWVDGTHTLGCSAVNLGGLTGTCTPTTVTTSNSVTNKNYYVSAAGSDSNNCTSTGTSCATLTKITTLHLYGGDTVNVKGGDTINDCFIFVAASLTGGSQNNPVTFQPYGGGTPTVHQNCGDGTTTYQAPIKFEGTSGVVWNGINCTATAVPTSQVWTCFSLQPKTTAETDWVTIENADFSGGNRSEIGIHASGPDTHVCGTLAHIRITNMFLHGTTGVSSYDASGLWGLGCGTSAPGLQKTVDLVTQGVDAYNLGGDGVNGSNSGGLLYLSMENPTGMAGVAHDINWNNGNICGSGYAFWDFTTDGLLLETSEGYNVQANGGFGPAGCDVGGLDMDGGTTNTTYEYIYVHHNLGNGFQTLPCVAGFNYYGPDTVRYNILENNNFGGRGIDGTNLAGLCGGGSFLVYDYNNTIFSSTVMTGSGHDQAIGIGNGGFRAPWAVGTLVANNISVITGQSGNGNAVFISDDGSLNGIGNVTVINNLYYNGGSGNTAFITGGVTYPSFATWAAGTHQSTVGSIISNPLLVGPLGTNVTCYTGDVTIPTGPQPCPANYVNTVASPGIGVGLNLSTAPYSLSIGTRDYFGNTLGNGHSTGYNMGADGGYP